MERMQDHCPSLEHLSVMGNPGANKKLVHTLTSTPKADFKELSLATSFKIDYHEYILNTLPFLKSLDRIERSNKLTAQNKEVDSIFSSSRSTSISNNVFPKEDRSKKIFQNCSLKKLFQLKEGRKNMLNS